MQILSVLGVWVGGLGSLSAAVVALWLSRHSEKVKLKSHVGIRVLVGGGGPKEELLDISATNVGNRPVTISGVGWRAKIGRSPRYAVQIFGNPLSDTCPKTLHYGDTGSFKVFFSDSDWLKDFAVGFLKDASEKEVKTLRAQIYTSVGQTRDVVPEQRVFERLMKAREEAASD